MGFKCGIVGLPNVGKSTLFNALTNAGVGAENYPFCTIDPNIGVVPVPDPRLQAIAEIVQPEQVVSAQVEFVDIAGLVKGASRGEGLGNQFLAHVRETHATAQVVRCFEDDNVVHVSGRVDPVTDIDVINTELCLADQETLARALQKADKAVKRGDKQAVERKLLFEKLSAHIDSGAPARTWRLEYAEQRLIQDLRLLTAKPNLYIANVEETGIASNQWLEELMQHAAMDGSGLLVVSAAIETEIAKLAEDDRKEFLRDLGLSEPGLHRLVRAGYELLGLQTFFTTERGKVRAWTIRTGANAAQAAGLIHTDFERGFIRAEVIDYEDFTRYKGEQGAKDAGKWRLEGRDYIIADGDIVLFHFNV